MDPRPPNKAKRQKITHRGNKNTTTAIVPEGVRRSMRIQSRPLDDWRDKTFLCGRIQDKEQCNPLEIRPDSFSRETQPCRKVTHTEQIVGTLDPRPPNKAKRQKITQRGSENTTIIPEGVRRSTRIRSRPLDDWRGERFIYGRIHETMATVIGVKSYSPDEKGTVALRVKSFLSEDYSDIVTRLGKY